MSFSFFRHHYKDRPFIRHRCRAFFLPSSPIMRLNPPPGLLLATFPVLLNPLLQVLVPVAFHSSSMVWCARRYLCPFGLVLLAAGTCTALDPNWPDRDPSLNNYFTDWGTARGTFAYNNDGMSINYGSCGYGYIDPSKGLGLNVAAISDANPTYEGSCGRCYEIKCNPSVFKDGYGASIDRTQACYDPSKSIVMKIIDTCPCYYPANYYSNKRWCCGDMTHFDVSYWLMVKLADPKWGVIGLQYRQVPCPAGSQLYSPLIPNITTATNSSSSSSWTSSNNSSTSSNGNTNTVSASNSGSNSMSASTTNTPTSSQYSSSSTASGSSNTTAYGNNGGSTYSQSQSTSYNASTSVSGSSSNSGGGSGSVTSSANSSNGTSSNTGSGSGGTVPVLAGGNLESGFADASWSASQWIASSVAGVSDAAKCFNLSSGGAFAVQLSSGVLGGKKTLSFTTVKADGFMPSIYIALSSAKGVCKAVALSSLGQSGSALGAWRHVVVDLGSSFGSGSGQFFGCGGGSVQDINKIVFGNTLSSAQQVCFDQVSLS